MIFPRDYTTREQKNTGNHTFRRDSFRWEREIRISAETIWVGVGNQDFFGNCLGGTTGTIFCTGTGISPNSRGIQRDVSRGLPCDFLSAPPKGSLVCTYDIIWITSHSWAYTTALRRVWRDATVGMSKSRLRTLSEEWAP